MKRAVAALLLAFCLGTASARTGELDFGALGFGDTAGGGFSGFALAEKPLLQARLAPENNPVRPDAPFTVLLELTHLSGAYTYWKNPGGPGQGTTLRWTLPDGFHASEPQWPAPQLYQNAGITSYIHKGKILVPITITPPEGLTAGDSITLSGEVVTQVCTTRSCNPTRLPISIELAVADQAGQRDPATEQALAGQPAPVRNWRIDVAEYEGELIIGLYPRPGSNPDPTGIYFFDAGGPDVIIDSQKPQSVEKDGGVWWLRAPLLPGGSRVGGRLVGLLHADNGWQESASGPPAMAIDLPINAEGAGKPPGLQRGVRQDWALLLAFAFLGGLLLNIMPCVFPVIGLKIMGFAKQAHKDRRAIFLHGLAYTAGVLLCFWTLSFLVITMGRGWGAQLQSEWFLFALCHIFIIMSMNMAGVFEIGAPATAAGQAAAGHEGIKRSFFTGLLATITSTPCSAPFLGTALAYALSLPALLSLGVFTLMGLGFSSPYLALSLFPNWLKKLPRPGPWMETFRQAMCFPLFATAAYLFWTMEAMLPEWHFLMLLFGLVLTAMACWLYGKSQKSRARAPRGGRAALALAALALAGGLWLGLPKAAGELKWMEWSPEAVSRLREEGRPVYVDFTARWCATCQVNKRIYQNQELVELIKNKNVALLKADWTLYDDRITSTLKNEFNKAAVPVTVLYSPGQRRADVLPDLLTVGNVSEVLRGLP